MQAAVFLCTTIIVIIVDLVLFFLSLKKRKEHTIFFSLTMLLCAVSEVLYTSYVFSDDFFLMKLSLGGFFASFTLMLVCLLVFMLYFAEFPFNRQHKIVFGFFFVFAVIDICFELSNPFNGLAVSFTRLENSVMKWNYIANIPLHFHFVFSYIIIAVIVLYILYRAIKTPFAYRQKYTIAFSGICIAVAINAVCIIIRSYGILDFSQISYSIVGSFIYYEVFHFSQKRMLNNTREMIIDELGQPVILFGEKNMFAACNKSASDLLPTDVSRSSYDLNQFIIDHGYSSDLCDRTENTSFIWNDTNRNTSYRVDYRVIFDKKSRLIGRLFLFSDNSLEIDPLTGFQSQAAFERAYYTDPSETISGNVIVFDINRLSGINHTHGRNMGDSCIRKLADALRSYFPEDSCFARLNDANLLVICKSCPLSRLRQLVDKISSDCSKEEKSCISFGIQSSICEISPAKDGVRTAVETALFSMRSKKMLDRSSAHSSLMDSLSQVLMEADEATEAHVLRTQALGNLLGRRLELTDLQLSNLSLLCLLHDIGKLGIPVEVLNKPGKLSFSEKLVMQEHVQKGYRIAKASPELSQISEYILYHHEFWNGTGYPDGLSHESIPLLSRIISIIDAYDAMTNYRPYKRTMSDAEARQELKNCSGIQFDPRITSEFLALLEEIKPLTDEIQTKNNEHEPVSPDAPDFSPEETAFVKKPVLAEYIIDRNYRIIYIDDSFTEFTGYTLQDIKNYTITQWDLLPHEDCKYYRYLVEKSLAENKGSAYLEHRIICKDKSYRLVMCLGVPFTDPAYPDAVSKIRVIDTYNTISTREAARRAHDSMTRSMARWEKHIRKDSLTGLFNHEAFINDVESDLQTTKNQPVLIILDIDVFKNYNDTYGHLEGDNLIRLLSNVLKDSVKDIGFAGRLGGDEFAAYFTVPDGPDADANARQTIRAIFDKVSQRILSAENPASISLGAVLAGTDNRTFRLLYSKADAALYQSKDKGRNTYTVIE